MCDIIKKSRRKTFTGYKVAIEYKGHYYSPYSGIRYSLGKVPVSARIEKEKETKFGGEYSINYNSKMKGMTGVFLTLGEGKKMLNSFLEDAPHFALLKMTLSGDLFDSQMTTGYWYTRDTVIGSHIQKIVKIQ